MVGKSEPTPTENKPVGKEEGKLLPTTSGQQKEEVSLEGGDKKIGPSFVECYR